MRSIVRHRCAFAQTPILTSTSSSTASFSAQSRRPLTFTRSHSPPSLVAATHRTTHWLIPKSTRLSWFSSSASIASTSSSSSSPSVSSVRYDEVTYSRDDDIKKVAPCLHRVFTLTGRTSEGVAVTVKQRLPHPTGADLSKIRTPYDSALRLHYQFSSNDALRQRYSLFHSSKVRFGRILEDLDALAGDLGYRHTGTEDVTIVTAVLDRVNLPVGLATLDNDLVLDGTVIWVGSSSMEMQINFYSLSPHVLALLPSSSSSSSSSTDDVVQSISPLSTLLYGTGSGSPLAHPIATASFVMVARDKSRPVSSPVPELTLLTEQQRRQFQMARENKLQRKLRGEAKHAPPTQAEILELHQVHLLKSKPATPFQASVISMKSTECESTQLMHGQDRNHHLKVFGGHLIRLALELAHSTTYLATHNHARLIEMDDVNFIHPVEIGAIVKFAATVIYSNPSRSFAVCHVAAIVCEPHSGSRKVTNEFYFHFVCEQGMPYIQPERYEEITKWLEGKRRAQIVLEGLAKQL